MIEYDPKAYGIFFMFRITGSVIPRGMVWSIPNGLITYGVHHLIHNNVDLSGMDVLWSGYTFVLGFLVVFRNSQAYSRFWEGATLIQQVRGEWFNAISSLFSFCNCTPERAEKVLIFQHLLVRLMSMLFCQALQQICDLDDDSLEIINVNEFDFESLRFLAGTNDRVEVILQWLQRAIVDANDDGIIRVAPPILSRAFQELSRGIVNLNNVRKIKEVPFPFPYAQMIGVMLLIHFLVTPLIAAHYIANPIAAAFLSALVTNSFWSLLYIGQEIDHPFGEDPNDLEIADMQQAMNTSLITLLHPSAQSPPTITDLTLSLVSSDHIIVGTAEVTQARKRKMINIKASKGTLNPSFSSSFIFGSKETESTLNANRVRRLSELIQSITPDDQWLLDRGYDNSHEVAETVDDLYGHGPQGRSSGEEETTNWDLHPEGPVQPAIIAPKRINSNSFHMVRSSSNFESDLAGSTVGQVEEFKQIVEGAAYFRGSERKAKTYAQGPRKRSIKTYLSNISAATTTAMRSEGWGSGPLPGLPETSEEETQLPEARRRRTRFKSWPPTFIEAEATTVGPEIAAKIAASRERRSGVVGTDTAHFVCAL